jgi:acyl-coenzyme A thioesterase PaaI-like protein
MPESWSTRLARWGFNLFPAYWGSGATITYIARDWSEVRIRLRLSWRTRNYVGTIFGGSMYAAVDPVYMIMLMKRLGPAYTVWDKAATIRFRRPGRSVLKAEFRLDAATLDAIRGELANATTLDRVFTVELRSADGTVHAVVEKTLHIGRREADPDPRRGLRAPGP